MLRFQDIETPRNYRAARFDDVHGAFTVLFNVRSPLIAFSAVDIAKLYMPQTFIECQRAHAAFAMLTKFDPVPLDILNQSLMPEDWSDLPATVRKDIEFWRPYTVGQVLFNDWD